MLETPWQYDRATIHDGRKNMYSFMSNNVKIKLLPSKENEPKPSKGNGKNLLTRKEFVDEMLTFVVVFVLLGKESNRGREVLAKWRTY